MTKPIALLILDGWGHRNDTQYNAIHDAKTPNMDRLWQEYPHEYINASSQFVGLPEGQMGNSEVGHLNLGAGRVVYQDLSRISNAILDETFYQNPIFIEAIDKAVQADKAVHVFGLLSDGGIHSHERQIQALMRLAAKHGAKKLYMHAFLDGRDTPPKSADKYLQHMEMLFKELGTGKIGSIQGRFYVMDRDKRWDRVKAAYDMFTLGKSERTFATAAEGLQAAYDAGETDEFVKPTLIHGDNESAAIIQDGDAVIFMNYRADRAREITRAFTEKDFSEFDRGKVPALGAYVTLTEYHKDFTAPIAFPPEQLKNTLGEYLAAQGKSQLRIAETEKYAHVTFFFDGGEEHDYPHEDKILIPSPKVAHYDETPKMSAVEITDNLVKAIESEKYDVIICNYANCDMIGHTGKMEQAIEAVECVDECVGRVIDALQNVGGEAIITADHGNAELMFDPKTEQPHTAHTQNQVPLIYVGRKATLHPDAALCNVAPTILTLLDLPIPKEMTAEPMLDLG